MPGFLLHVGAQVSCSHGGQATPTATNLKVLVNGQPTVLVTAPYLVAGCTLPPPTAANGPCVSAQWLPVTGTTRVTSFGQPLLVLSSQELCAPTGTPVIIGNTQKKVSAI